MVISLEEMGKKARQSAFELAQTPTSLKNAVLNKMADARDAAKFYGSSDA